MLQSEPGPLWTTRTRPSCINPGTRTSINLDGPVQLGSVYSQPATVLTDRSLPACQNQSSLTRPPQVRVRLRSGPVHRDQQMLPSLHVAAVQGLTSELTANRHRSDQRTPPNRSTAPPSGLTRTEPLAVCGRSGESARSPCGLCGASRSPPSKRWRAAARRLASGANGLTGAVKRR